MYLFSHVIVLVYIIYLLFIIYFILYSHIFCIIVLVSTVIRNVLKLGTRDSRVQSVDYLHRLPQAMSLIPGTTAGFLSLR